MSEFVEKVETLRHMVGAVSNIKPKEWGYRNYFCAGIDSHEHRLLDAMQADGLVREYRRSAADIYFACTEDGCKAAGLNAAQIKRALTP